MRSEEEARRLLEKLRQKGYGAYVEPIAIPDKGTWYRVRLGPYTTLEDLNRVRRVLAQNGIDASLVKLKDQVSTN